MRDESAPDVPQSTDSYIPRNYGDSDTLYSSEAIVSNQQNAVAKDSSQGPGSVISLTNTNVAPSLLKRETSTSSGPQKGYYSLPPKDPYSLPPEDYYFALPNDLTNLTNPPILNQESITYLRQPDVVPASGKLQRRPSPLRPKRQPEPAVPATVDPRSVSSEARLLFLKDRIAAWRQQQEQDHGTPPPQHHGSAAFVQAGKGYLQPPLPTRPVYPRPPPLPPPILPARSLFSSRQLNYPHKPVVPHGSVISASVSNIPAKEDAPSPIHDEELQRGARRALPDAIDDRRLASDLGKGAFAALPSSSGEKQPANLSQSPAIPQRRPSDQLVGTAVAWNPISTAEKLPPLPSLSEALETMKSSNRAISKTKSSDQVVSLGVVRKPSTESLQGAYPQPWKTRLPHTSSSFEHELQWIAQQQQPSSAPQPTNDEIDSNTMVAGDGHQDPPEENINFDDFFNDILGDSAQGSDDLSFTNLTRKQAPFAPAAVSSRYDEDFTQPCSQAQIAGLGVPRKRWRIESPPIDDKTPLLRDSSVSSSIDSRSIGDSHMGSNPELPSRVIRQPGTPSVSSNDVSGDQSIAWSTITSNTTASGGTGQGASSAIDPTQAQTSSTSNGVTQSGSSSPPSPPPSSTSSTTSFFRSSPAILLFCLLLLLLGMCFQGAGTATYFAKTPTAHDGSFKDPDFLTLFANFWIQTIGLFVSLFGISKLKEQYLGK